MWTNDKVLELIEDYHAAVCLWDVTSPEYRDRVLKKIALRAMAEKHGVSVYNIEKKLHNLRTSLNRERKKVKQANGTSLKKSNWFAYEHLLFLPSFNVSRGSLNTGCDEDTKYGRNEYEVSFDHGGDLKQEETLHEDMERGQDVPLLKISSNPPKRSRMNEYTVLQQAAHLTKSLSEVVSAKDEYSLLGEYVTHKIRNCERPRVEVTAAQRFINDILFRLEVGMLADQTPHIRSSDIHFNSRTAYTSNIPQYPSSGNSSVASFPTDALLVSSNDEVCKGNIHVYVNVRPLSVLTW